MENTVDVRPDQSKGEDAQVQHWLSEIRLAEKAEDGWRQDAKHALKVYRSQGIEDTASSGTHTRKDVFNILWANTEIKRQALYANLPIPDIRRRHKDKDPLGKAVSELLERCVTYTLDCQEVHTDLVAATLDCLLPGRAITRIRYKAHLSEVESEPDPEQSQEAAAEAEKRVDYEEAQTEQVQWDDFIRGPGKTWDEVSWICFIHKLTKQEVKARWEKFADDINYDVVPASDDGQKSALDKTDDTVFKRATVYELWDKESRKVYWLNKGYSDAFLEIDDDPLELKQFFPVPQPLYAIEDPATLVPQTEFSKYSALTEELEILTRRINRIVNALRVRGVYDGRLKGELEKLMRSSDNELIPADSVAAILGPNGSGGLEKAIWMLPIEQLAKVYQILTQQRNQLIGQIYEVTGISDIIRGESEASETATAQKIKANFGSMRLERQKQAVQRYARDVIRLLVEVIAEHFSRETLSLMSGMNFPTMLDRQAAQQQMQMAQMRMQMLQVTGMAEQGAQEIQQLQQQMQQLQASPAVAGPVWEEIEEVLHSDFLREYRVDIETDSTIAVDQQRDQQVLTEFMNGMGQFTRYAGEAMSTGLLAPGAAKAMMVAFARKFKLGREVENELEQMEPPKQQANPEAEKAQAEVQKQQAQLQMDREKHQMDMERETQQLQAEREKASLEIQVERQKAQTELAKDREALALERERMAMQRASMATKSQYEQESHTRKMEALKESDREKSNNG